MRVLLSLLLVCATSSAALADGFFVTESAGGTDITDELSASVSSAVRVRLSAGYRHRNWALEGWFAANMGTGSEGGYAGSSPSACGPERCYQPDGIHGGATLVTYGLDLKYLKPVSRHLELYLRGGLSRGVLDGDGDYAGRGLGLGAGAQLSGKVPALGFLFWPFFFTDLGPKVTAAVFVESGYEFYRLHRDGIDGAGSIDAQLNHLTIGFAVGNDF